jgi:hypothetical protein
MLTRESLSVIFNELEEVDRIVAVFTGLVPPYPIGDVYKINFRDQLILLIDLGCRDKWICESAAMDDSLECLKYAHEHNCPWDERICAWAARNLECLEYAHTHGCPWDELTCAFAADNGSLACLKYAHEHGCPWNRWTCEWASNDACLEYAIAYGCPQ